MINLNNPNFRILGSHESGYYPAGAEHDPDAPYNQVDPPQKEVTACCSQSLSKSVNILADYDEYNEDFIDLDYDYKQQHETPLKIIEKFKEALEKGELPKNKEYWIDECKEWINDETVVVED